MFEATALGTLMLSVPGPELSIEQVVTDVAVIGETEKVHDIYTAIHAGYTLALK